MTLYADIEADGFLDTVTRVWCLVIKDTAEDDVEIYHDHPGRYRATGSVTDGLNRLAEADVVVGHNWIGYDDPALRKLYPAWPGCKRVLDTQVMSRLCFPEIAATDRKTRLPQQYHGAHTLASWGARLKFPKDSYTGGFDAWNEEMIDYCVQDVRVTEKVGAFLKRHLPPSVSVRLEHDFATVIEAKNRYGIPLDDEEAAAFEARLRGDLRRATWDLQDEFPSFRTWELKGRPKSKHAVLKTRRFNANSNDHILTRLMERGWKPKERTDPSTAYPEGQLKTSEDVLSRLKIPGVEKILHLKTISGALARLSTGKVALRKMQRAGRIHPGDIHNGTATSRVALQKPNMNLPAVGKGAYAEEFRSLIKAPEGWTLFGSDASGIDGRVIAHYLAPFDGGKFARSMVDGDIHTENMQGVHSLGIDCTRDQAKGAMYACAYGARPKKVSSQFGWKQDEAVEIHRFLNEKFGLSELHSAVDAEADKGWLLGLDGRRIPVRQRHAAFNYKIQGGSAVLMKHWVVGFSRATAHLEGGLCIFPHDEQQYQIRPHDADEHGRLAEQTIKEAGEAFDLRTTLECEWSTGATWFDTH